MKKINGWINQSINQSALTASNDQLPESVFNIMSFYYIAIQRLRGSNHWAMKWHHKTSLQFFSDSHLYTTNPKRTCKFTLVSVFTELSDICSLVSGRNCWEGGEGETEEMCDSFRTPSHDITSRGKSRKQMYVYCRFRCVYMCICVCENLLKQLLFRGCGQRRSAAPKRPCND